MLRAGGGRNLQRHVPRLLNSSAAQLQAAALVSPPASHAIDAQGRAPAPARAPYKRAGHGRHLPRCDRKKRGADRTGRALREEKRQKLAVTGAELPTLFDIVTDTEAIALRLPLMLKGCT